MNTNEAETKIAERAGASAEIELHPDLKQTGVAAHHEAEHLRDVQRELGHLNVHPAGEATPVSIQSEGIIDPNQFEIARHKPPVNAIRWLAEQIRLKNQRKEFKNA